MTRHPDLLARDDSILLLVDIQERLAPIIDRRADVVAASVLLSRGAAILGVPILVSEQYPGGLGGTLPEVVDAARGARTFAKMSFSCCGEPAILDAIRASDRGTVVIAGVEAHICVLQTALDLIARGFRVHVAADAAGSRYPGNRDVGLARAARAGATITCVESVLFEWLRRCDAAEFKAVWSLLK